MTAMAAQVSVSPANIRPARIEDCATILKMIRALAQYQGIADRVTAKSDQLRRDGFGDAPKFEALIADNPHNEPIGLAIFQTQYAAWDAATCLQITDLFVDESARGTGIGFRLVAEVARIARERGCKSLQINMVHANPSRASLDRMGLVHQDDLLHYALDSGGLRRLAEMAQ